MTRQERRQMIRVETHKRFRGAKMPRAYRRACALATAREVDKKARETAEMVKNAKV